MTQLENLEDICDLEIKSLQEVISELSQKNRLKFWEEVESHLIKNKIAPSLSAY